MKNKLISKHQTGAVLEKYTQPTDNLRISTLQPLRLQNNTASAQSVAQSMPQENQEEQSLFNQYMKKARDLEVQQYRRSKSQTIPYIEDKQITLTNAGKLTGAKLSTNMLDSLAKYGAIVGLPIWSAIGLAGQETTFGTYSGYDKASDNNPQHLVNDHAYSSNNPYYDLLETARKKALKIDPTYGKEYEQALDSIINAGVKYTERQIPKWEKSVSMPVLQHAFTKYKQGTYNTGDPNHTRDVEKAGKAAFNSPEIQHWWNTEGYKWYE